FGKLNQKALIIQNTIIKNLPTQRAILKNPFFENEGIPFDYASDGILNAGTPVLISHFSKDKRYAFVLGEAGFGFVESKNLEFEREKMRLEFQKSTQEQDLKYKELETNFKSVAQKLEDAQRRIF
ncbi:hypothetical protein PO81_11705, partial [Vibrio parahaemolyticus]